MTNAEFKKQFNTLYNNINNNAAPGLSDAEISIFLNKAQDEIVKSHVLGPTTTYQLGINQTSKRDVELDKLVISTTYTADNGSLMHPNGVLATPNYTIATGNPSTSITYNPLIILSEVVKVRTNPTEEQTPEYANLDIVELSYALFNKFMAGVYKHPKKNQCWKLRHDDKIEFIPPVGTTITVTNIRQVYVKTPQLITIDSTKTDGAASDVDTCELPEVLHPEILQRAVELAKAAYAAQDVNIQMSMGLRSE